jgi:hypothetical protein
MAWTGAVHDYMCPDGYNIDCKIADYSDFQENYPYGAHQYHLCYDNKSDGVARLVAKYYVKKYYVEGQQDSKLLGAAAHLLQDASCPDHWYPTREIFGRIIVPFAPSWVGTIESQVESHVVKYEKDWSIPIDFQGKIITINDAYLLSQKAYVQDFLSKEPEQSLEEIQKQLDAKIFWSGLRSYKEWIIVCAIISVPFLAYEAWQLKRKEKLIKTTDKIGTIIVALILGVLLFLFILIQLFY